jgi:hypothetical protein
LFACVYFFAAIELNIDGFDEEGDFEDFEVQGQIANQGKPNLLHILIPVLIMQVFLLCLFKDALFCNCYYLLIAIRWRLGSTSDFLSSLR